MSMPAIPLLLRAFLQNPRGVASAIPTSRFILRRITAIIDGSKRRVIVEYGPGTGVIAKELLKERKFTADSMIILIEKDETLAHALKASVHDPRVFVFHDSAENAVTILQRCGEQKADYVILSIPLTFMRPAVRNNILETTRGILKDDGLLIATLFRPIVRKYIRAYFPRIKTTWEPRNIPPLLIMEAGK